MIKSLLRSGVMGSIVLQKERKGTPSTVAEITGLKPEEIIETARIYATTKPPALNEELPRISWTQLRTGETGYNHS